MCEDLEVNAEDIVMLVLSWQLHAAYMCEFTKEEFITGMTELEAESIEDLKKKLPAFREELKDVAKFREVFVHFS